MLIPVVETYGYCVILTALQSSWFSWLEDVHLYVRSSNLCSIEYFSITLRCIVWRPLSLFSR